MVIRRGTIRVSVTAHSGHVGEAELVPELEKDDGKCTVRGEQRSYQSELQPETKPSC